MLGMGHLKRKSVWLAVACLNLGGLALVAFGFSAYAQVDPALSAETVGKPTAAGIEITPTSLSVTEGETATAAYTIALTGRPQDTVVIYISPDDQTLTDFVILVCYVVKF